MNSSVSLRVIPGAVSPSVSKHERERIPQLRSVSQNVLQETNGHSSQQREAAAAASPCEQTGYREFLIAFTAPDQVFHFTAAGTSAHLSGNRNTSLHGG